MRFRLIPLEERIVLDATLAAVVVDAISDVADPVEDAEQSEQQLELLAEEAVDAESVVVEEAAPQLVVISRAVDHFEQLIEAASEESLILTYDAQTSLSQLEQQIRLATAGRSLDSIGFINHGQQGRFALTDSVSVDMESLESSPELRAFWEAIGSLVKDGGRIDLLACNLAEGETALLDAIDSLADVNGDVSIAASTNVTGSTSFGGDWILEHGVIDAGDLYFDTAALSVWDGHLLLTVNDDVDTTDEETPITIDFVDLTSNDVTDDPPVEVIGIDDTGTVGQVTVGLASIDYDPNGQFEGLGVGEFATDSFTYEAEDGDELTGTGTVTITIDGVNDDPTADDDADATDEDTILTIDTATLLTNDSDPDTNDVLFVDSVDATSALGAAITVTSTGGGGEILGFTYDPTGVAALNALATGESDTDTFSYTISDGNGGISTATVTITVEGVNDDPVADDDADSTDEDTILTVDTADLLSNDSDPDTNDAIFVDSIDATSALGGTITVTSTGGGGEILEFTYDPTTSPTLDALDAGEDDTDTFTYTISDGNGGLSTATVTITVDGVNDAPTVVDDNAGTTDEDTIFTVDTTTFLTNDSDPEGHVFFVGDIAATSTGGATITISSQVGSAIEEITYDPTGVFDYLGITATAVPQTFTDTFTYTAEDEFGATREGTVTLTVTAVNDNPTGGDDTATATEDGGAIIIDVADLLLNDTDVDQTDTTLTVTAVDSAGAQGTVTPIFAGSNVVQIQYDPGANFQETALGDTVTDDFLYTISDGKGGVTSNVRVEIIIDGVNDAPVAVVDDLGAITEDDLQTDFLPISLLNNDFDDIGDATQITDITVTTDPGGIFTVTDDGSGNITGFSFDPNGEFEALGTSFDGTVPETALFEFDYTIEDPYGETSSSSASFTIIGVNDVPVVTGETITVSNQVVTTFDVINQLLNNDTDVDDDDIAVVFLDLAVLGTQGTVTNQVFSVGALQTFDYDPTVAFAGLAAGATATDSIAYAVTDFHTGVLESGILEIIVEGGIDPAVAVADTVDATEDDILLIPAADLLDNDTIPGTANIISVDSTGITTGQLATATTGGVITSIAYNPDGVDADLESDFNFLSEGQTSTTSFTYTIEDGEGNQSTATVTINVEGENDTPDADADSFTITEDQILNIFTPTDLLANDSDPDFLDTLTVSGVDSTGTNGTVIPFATGGAITTISFDPSGGIFQDLQVGESRDTTFDYTISDGEGGTDTTTVTITVTGVNDAPVATSDIALTPTDTAIDIDVGFNDFDVDHDFADLVFALAGAPSNGSYSLNGDNTINYTPDPGFIGTDTFFYSLTDPAGGVDIGEVTVVVGPLGTPPVAQNDNPTVNEDGSVLIDVLANDSDPDLDPITLVQIVSGPSNGVATPNFGDGTVLYEPDPDYNGSDSFVYEITDGQGNFVQATVNITVDPVNDDPTADDLTLNTPEDTPIGFSLDDLADDIDGDDLTLSVSTPPANGTADYDAQTGNVLYTPNQDFNGTDSFVYTVDDGAGGIVTGTVTIDVDPVNDTPETANGFFTINEDTNLTIDLSTLASDVDDLFGDLTLQIVTPPSNGAASLVGSNIEYTPTLHFNGTDTIVYRATDQSGAFSEGTITITVDPVGDPVTAVSDVANTDRSFSVDIPVLDNDIDPDNQATPLLVEISTAPGNGSAVVNPDNTVTYTPDVGFFGVDTFYYRITDSDGNTSTAEVVVTVNFANQDPAGDDTAVTTNEDAAILVDVGSLISDPDGDAPLFVSTFSGPSNGSLGLVGTVFTYTPNLNFNGSDSFVYSVSDIFGGTDQGTVTINVDPVNDDPTADSFVVTATEDTALVIPLNPRVNDVDGDAPLVISIISGPTNGGATFNATSNEITYTPNLNYNGPDEITYAVDDGNGGTAQGVITINVDPVNDAPIGADLTASTDEDTQLIVDTAPSLADVDSPVGDLTIHIVSGPSNGTASVVGQTIEYDPTPNYNGPDQLTYEVRDASGGVSVSYTVDITVNPIPDPITAIDDGVITVQRNIPLDIAVQANDIDPDNEILTVSIVTPPANGTATVNPDGTVNYDPNTAYVGADSFVYQIRDSDGNTSQATVTIDVVFFNRDPVGLDTAASTPEETPVDIDLTSLVSDIDLDALSISIDTPPANGGAVVNGFIITYTPSLDYNGPDQIIYEVSDGLGGTDTGVIDLTVTPVNDAPTAADFTVTTPEDIDIPISLLIPTAQIGDVDLDTLTLTVVGGPSNGLFSVDDGLKTITYDPALNFNGVDQITYRITDPSGAFDEGTIEINVTPVNDAPVAVDDARLVWRDSFVNLDPRDNDIDVDGDVLTATPIGGSGPSNGAVIVEVDGTLTYIPNPGYVGSDSFDVLIEDPSGGSSISTVNLEIREIPLLWGVDETDGELFSITDPGNPAATFESFGDLHYRVGSGPLMPLGTGVEGIAINDNFEAFVSINKASLPGVGEGPFLGVVDLRQVFPGGAVLNEVQIVGPIDGLDAASQAVTGLAFDPNSGSLYGLIHNTTGPDDLAVIDAADGSIITILGPGLIGPDVIDGQGLAFNEDGQLFVTDAATDTLFEVSPATGEVLGPIDSNEAGGIGPSADFRALTFDPLGDRLLTVEQVDTELVELTLADGGNLPIDPLVGLGLTNVEAIEFLPVDPLGDGTLMEIETDGIRNYIPERPPREIVNSSEVRAAPGLDFDTATIRVELINGTGATGDTLDIKNRGPVSINPGNLYYGGTLIGSYSGGAGGTPLVINFNGTGVTPQMVSEVVQAVTFQNSDAAATAGVRQVLFDVTAAGGEQGNRAVHQLDVLDAADFEFGFQGDNQSLPPSTRAPFNQLLGLPGDLGPNPRVVTISSISGGFYFDPDLFEPTVLKGLGLSQGTIGEQGQFIQFFLTQSNVDQILNHLFYESPEWGDDVLEVVIDDLGSSGGAPRIDTFNVQIDVLEEGAAGEEGEEIPDELPPVDRD